MFVVLKSFVSVVMSVLCVFSSVAFGNFAAPYEPKKENCKVNFAVISDVHMTDETARRDMLKLGLYDMANAKVQPDALIIAGDMTDHGRSAQYELLAEAFAAYTPAKNIIMAMGNHDTWNDETDNENEFPESERMFIKYNKEIAGRDINKVYYSTQVNGYTFIVMSSEYDHTDAYISAEQLAWLDSELEAAAKNEKPVFVVSHWPFNQTHGLPLTWLDNPIVEDKDGLAPNDGGFGEQSDAVEAILKKYKNVFLISGHLHSGLAKNSTFGYSSVEKKGNINTVNLPCYMYLTIKGRVANGTGFQFEVYEDEVLIRGRSFTAGVWYTDYEYTVKLEK